MPDREAPRDDPSSAGGPGRVALRPRLSPPPRVTPGATGSSRRERDEARGRRWLGPLLLLVLVAAVAAVFLWLPGVIEVGERPAGSIEGAALEGPAAGVSVTPATPATSERGVEEPPSRSPATSAAATKPPDPSPDEPSAAAPPDAPLPRGRPAASVARALPAGESTPGRSADPSDEALAAGLEALATGDARGAEEAFRRALEIDPGSAEAGRGLEEARGLLLSEALEELVARGRQAEEAEDWRRAEAAWSSALALDPAVKVAQEGRGRAAARAALAEAIAFHLSHPERLAAPAVLTEAEALRVRAATASPDGPLHRRQLAALEALITRATRPVEVVLSSDGETEVTVQRVGALGRFERRVLELRPGVYSVIGSRRGFRDVRLRLEVASDGEVEGPVRLDVRCEEAF